MDRRYLVYGTRSCFFCLRAEKELTAREKDFIFIDLAKESDFLQEAKTFYNQETVPIILENDLETGHTRLVGGCDDLLNLLGVD